MINSLRLQNFRSYTDESFEFDSGVNIVVGPNGSGKTNLLEAILVAVTGKSYRARDQELLREGSPWARLDADLTNQKRTVKLVAQSDDRTTKEFTIDGMSLHRLTWRHTRPLVLFEPSHMQLLNGGPEARRNYLDNLLEQTTSEFANINRKYKRALAQRNYLLKHATQGDQLFAWNVRLSELGGQIAEDRLAMIEKLGESTKLYGQLSRTKDRTTLEYKASCDSHHYASSMLKKLEHQESIDKERGFTGVGPHRDDLIVLFNGHPNSMVASRGEARTIVLALKAVEINIIEQSRGQAPILLLDDVFSELDGARRRALTELLAGYQTFITTTDADVVIQHFLNDCRVIPMGQGK